MVTLNSFLLFDSGEGDINRLMLFGTSNFIYILKESNDWYCDGTFKVVPALHCSCKQRWIYIPLRVCLHAKTEET